MSHKVTRILILAVCSTAIAVVPAAADDFADYLGSYTTSGLNGQDITYSTGTTLFDDGNLQFQFTGLTITPTCTDITINAVVACATGAYNPTLASSLSIEGTSQQLGMNGSPGFDLTGEVDVNSYTVSNGSGGFDTIDVSEDINLNYTVSTINGASVISGAGLDAAVCINDPSSCITTGNNLPPSFKINENWAGTNQTINVNGTSSVQDAFVSFLPSTYNSLQVSKDIFLDSGSCSGCSVSFSDLKQFYSEVPEPRAVAWILALGLFGLVQLRRRMTSQV